MDFVGEGHPRSTNAILDAAKSIGADADMLSAIVSVETAGSGFDTKGRPKALFEPHRFYKELDSIKLKTKLKQAIAAGLAYPNWGEKPYPADSYPRILKAMAIDADRALRATSWGLPQILGSNCVMANYPTAKDMVEGFKISEDNQIKGMASFLKAAGLVAAMNRHDFAKVAAGYNGTQYKRGGYDTKLRDAYERLQAPHKTKVADALDMADVIQKAQQRLRDLGYFEVGTPDGKVGTKTIAATTAFQVDNGLDHTGKLDEGTLDVLMDVRTPHRTVSVERATATPKDLKDRQPVKTGSWIQKIGAGMLVSFGLGGVTDGTVNFDDFSHGLTSARSLWSTIGSLSPWIIGLIVAGVVIYAGRKVIWNEVQAFREGRHG